MLRTRLPAVLLSLAAVGSVRADAPAVPAYPAPAEVRAAFRKLLDRPCKMTANPSASITKGDFTTQTVGLLPESDATDGPVPERIPVLLVKPAAAKGRLPAVIVLHGTGGSKEGMRSWLEDLARRGIVGVAIDARYHGERARGAKGATPYNAAIVHAWRQRPGERQAHPFYYDTCYDLWRTLDYLQTRPDIDPNRLGMMGVSMGGIETWLAASVDERVKVAAPLIGVQSLGWGLENDRWQGRANTIRAASEAAAKDLGEPKVNAKVCRALWDKVVPGLRDRFDCPSMLRLFAGRPLLICNGENDPNCPLEGAKLAFAAAEAAYRKADATAKLQILVAEGVGHKVTDEHRRATLDWFVKWLKP